jgi:hypothetical protein
VRIKMEYEAKAEIKVNNTTAFFSTMRCIRCPECGEEILMVPTLAKMIEAIENHINTHRKQEFGETSAATLKPPNIRTDLTEQVLEQASKMFGVSQKSSLWLQQE